MVTSSAIYIVINVQGIGYQYTTRYGSVMKTVSRDKQKHIAIEYIVGNMSFLRNETKFTHEHKQLDVNYTSEHIPSFKKDKLRNLHDEYTPPDNMPSLETKTKTKTQILVWNFFHTRTLLDRNHPKSLVHECTNCTCYFTFDKSALRSSLGVLFDIRSNTMIKTNGKVNIPRYRMPDQYWIIYNNEAMFQNESFYDVIPGNVYNLTATYRHNSDIHLPYGECQRRSRGNFTLPVGFPAAKTGFVIWHVSHCTDRGGRMSYVQQLLKHITVEIVGLCGNKTLENDVRPRIGETLSTVAEDNINQYKFYLAFENTYCKEYMTEKVFKILQDHIYTVPVVRGSGPYEGVLPPGSYINADDFESAEHLAEYLTKLDNNDTLYLEYFKSRRDYQCVNHCTINNPFLCRICDSLTQLSSEHVERSVNRTDMMNLFHPKQNCVSF